ncbi:hypothetical protein B0J11DRAFT_504761 [Dendryphion nanum]|uniref:Uncharacterized protein n=1 Tax=Dendryphion nanum TaxID=256645 RepID=A0A9P9E084_9PLEO|nr:hypothetical protein B0J11DRAFT_504761 [Dendryphion nanum]
MSTLQLWRVSPFHLYFPLRPDPVPTGHLPLFPSNLCKPMTMQTVLVYPTVLELWTTCFCITRFTLMMETIRRKTSSPIRTANDSASMHMVAILRAGSLWVLTFLLVALVLGTIFFARGRDGCWALRAGASIWKEEDREEESFKKEKPETMMEKVVPREDGFGKIESCRLLFVENYICDGRNRARTAVQQTVQTPQPQTGHLDWTTMRINRVTVNARRRYSNSVVIKRSTGQRLGVSLTDQEVERTVKRAKRQ